MKHFTVALVIVALLVAARPADAGVRRALKKTGSAVVHAVENAVVVAATIAGFILVCGRGACG